MDFTHWNIFWTILFCVTALVVATGNLVTIGIFLKTKLRKRRHFLLISLAIADMLVGVLSVPLYIAVGIHPYKLLLILSYQCVDIFTGLISIFTLASISLERMHAIAFPLRHLTLTSKFYMCVIGIPWIVGLPRAVLKTSGTVFPIRISRPANNIYVQECSVVFRKVF